LGIQITGIVGRQEGGRLVRADGGQPRFAFAGIRTEDWTGTRGSTENYPFANAEAAAYKLIEIVLTRIAPAALTIVRGLS
jgi:hypothetical protein